MQPKQSISSPKKERILRQKMKKGLISGFLSRSVWSDLVEFDVFPPSLLKLFWLQWPLYDCFVNQLKQWRTLVSWLEWLP